LNAISTLEDLVQNGRQPDLTVLLDIDPVVGIERARLRAELDRFEEEELAFFERVRAGYLSRASKDSRFKVVDASQNVTAVQADLAAILQPLLEGGG
jgi:dTMP kinase